MCQEKSHSQRVRVLVCLNELLQHLSALILALGCTVRPRFSPIYQHIVCENN
jgi:hypothetical protein